MQGAPYVYGQQKLASTSERLFELERAAIERALAGDNCFVCTEEMTASTLEGMEMFRLCGTQHLEEGATRVGCNDKVSIKCGDIKKEIVLKNLELIVCEDFHEDSIKEKIVHAAKAIEVVLQRQESAALDRAQGSISPIGQISHCTAVTCARSVDGARVAPAIVVACRGEPRPRPLRSRLPDARSSIAAHTGHPTTRCTIVDTNPIAEHAGPRLRGSAGRGVVWRDVGNPPRLDTTSWL